MLLSHSVYKNVKKQLICLKYACLHVFPHFYKKVRIGLGLKKFLGGSLRISVTIVNLRSLNVHRLNQKQGMKGTY